jgi:DNA-binding NtrC family response regulator
MTEWSVSEAVDRTWSGPCAAGSPSSCSGASADVLLVAREGVTPAPWGTELDHQGFAVRRVGPGGALAELRRCAPDGVIVDLAGMGGQACTLLRQIRDIDTASALIAVAAPGQGQAAAAAVEAGATLLVPPLGLPLLHTVLERSRLARCHAAALAYYREREAQRAGLRHLLGDSVPMVRLKTQLRLLLDDEAAGGRATPPPVLLSGESGTGKELVGRALHFEGRRRDRLFVQVEAGEWASPLAEVRLFGTDAAAAGVRGAVRGLVEAADGGTLFLRDIDLAPTSVQRRMAQLIEHGVVRRCEGLRETPVDVRVQASTRRPLAEVMHGDLLCSELRRALSAAPLAVAPLRERRDDLRLLSQRFLEAQAGRRGAAVPALSATARAMLEHHPWPGNVRELRHALERAFVAQRAGVIDSLHLGLPAPAAPADDGVTELRDVERDALRRALRQARGNVSRAARLLGVTRDTMRYRIVKHGLEGAGTRGGADAAPG